MFAFVPITVDHFLTEKEPKREEKNEIFSFKGQDYVNGQYGP